MDDIKIKKVRKNQQNTFDKIITQCLIDSYYSKKNIPVNLGKITEGDYFLILNNSIIGVLRLGRSQEFSGNYGIRFIGFIPEYRGQGLCKKVIDFCKNQAKKQKIEEIYLATPLLAKQTQSIFKKYGFKNKTVLTTVVFKDCYFMSLTETQLKYLKLSKKTGSLEWQIMALSITDFPA